MRRAAPRSQRLHPVAQQLGARRRPTSRGGTGWPHSGPFSTAATNGAPCSAQVTLGATAAKAPSGLSSQLLHGVGVDEVEPLVLHPGEQPGPRGDVDLGPAHVRHDRGRQPVDDAGPLPQAGLGAPATLVSLEPSNITCMPTQTPSTGRPPASRSSISRGPPTARSPRMQAWKLPTPGTNRPSAASTAAGRRSARRRHRRARACAPPSARCRCRSRAPPHGPTSSPPPSRPAGGRPRAPPRGTARRAAAPGSTSR